jgi:hypothetical protein
MTRGRASHCIEGLSDDYVVPNGVQVAHGNDVIAGPPIKRLPTRTHPSSRPDAASHMCDQRLSQLCVTGLQRSERVHHQLISDGGDLRHLFRDA